MLTSPQRMLLEMDERSRELERLVRSGDVDATTAYYANLARSGQDDVIKKLAILGDKSAQQAVGLIDDNKWSLSAKLERHIGDNQDRELSIMIADELVNEYEEKLHETIDECNVEVDVLPAASAHYDELILIRDYYTSYRKLQNQDAADSKFADLEYELSGESNQGGRLANLPFDNVGNFFRSLAGGVGLACLIRTTAFEASHGNNQYRPGMPVYVGNALLRAQSEGIPTAGVVERIRQRLQAQLF